MSPQSPNALPAALVDSLLESSVQLHRSYLLWRALRSSKLAKPAGAEPAAYYMPNVRRRMVAEAWRRNSALPRQSREMGNLYSCAASLRKSRCDADHDAKSQPAHRLLQPVVEPLRTGSGCPPPRPGPTARPAPWSPPRCTPGSGRRAGRRRRRTWSPAAPTVPRAPPSGSSSGLAGRDRRRGHPRASPARSGRPIPLPAAVSRISSETSRLSSGAACRSRCRSVLA